MKINSSLFHTFKKRKKELKEKHCMWHIFKQDSFEKSQRIKLFLKIKNLKIIIIKISNIKEIYYLHLK